MGEKLIFLRFCLVITLSTFISMVMVSPLIRSDTSQQDENQIEIYLDVMPSYDVNADNNTTHIAVEGNISYYSNDPRICTIQLTAEIDNWSTMIQPTVMHVRLRENSSFLVTIKVPKLTRDCRKELNISGTYRYDPGAPLLYPIDPHTEYLDLHVIKVNGSDTIPEKSEIAINIDSKAEYEIDPEDDETILDITGNIEYASDEAHICQITLSAEIDEWSAVISPSMISATDSGEYPFTITITIPKLSKEIQETLVIKGKYRYEAEGSMEYTIEPCTKLLIFKVLTNNIDTDDAGSSSNSDSPGFGPIIIVSAIVIGLIVYFRRR